MLKMGEIPTKRRLKTKFALKYQISTAHLQKKLRVAATMRTYLEIGAMKFPNLNHCFDTEDIRKLHECNSLRHSKMSH